MIVSDSHNMNFLFFTLILHTFQLNLKTYMFDLNDINFSVLLSLLK